MQIDPDKLKAAREAAHLRHADVAVAADLTERRIQQMEQGKSLKVNANIVAAIAKKCGVKVADLAKEA